MLGKSAAAAFAAIGLGALVSSTAAQAPALDHLPAAIQPSGMAVYLEVPATGVQLYTCGRNNAGAWAWNFKAPEAELFDTQKKPIGKHYAGPTWEGNDGGKIVGAVKANAPAPDGIAIPWLLLDVKSREGTGQLTQAQAILRVVTTGGLAPSQGCDEAHAGQESRVPYTATYLFLK
jgi:hypothetical protein